jgi:hypothetical protein
MILALKGTLSTQPRPLPSKFLIYSASHQKGIRIVEHVKTGCPNASDTLAIIYSLEAHR